MNILLVNWGTNSASSSFKFPLQEAVRLRGDNVFCVTSRSIPDEIRNIFNQENLIFSDPYDYLTLLKDVIDYSVEKNISFDVITTFFEMNVFHSAVLAEYFGCKKRLPFADALNTSVNKLAMRQKVAVSKIDQPDFYCFDKHSLKEAFKFHQQHNYRSVVKPIHSGHSFGARVVFSKNQDIFLSEVEVALTDFRNSPNEFVDYLKKDNFPYLIEEYIGGVTYSLDGFIAENHQEITFIGSCELEDDNLKQFGHTVPIASLTPQEINNAKKYAKKVIKALELKYCAFNCEFKIEKGKPFLIEVSGRFAGGDLMHSYQQINKYSIYEMFFNIFEEKNRSLQEKSRSYFLSESKKSVFINKRFFRVTKVPTLFEHESKFFSFKIDSTPVEDHLYSDDNRCWLFSLSLSSKLLNSRELIILREKIIPILIAQYEFKFDLVFITKHYLNFFKKFLKNRVVSFFFNAR